ncbi:tRNA guanosine(34) transglycosylase Tgt [Candidatus Pacearchaeota archaeon]|jgi:queuine tRNA-ribosyltransferase|nr:tRNA guanosine(34) transglycosylase Tgt [Candidatus Pacearchaeota archaeon]
MVFTISHKDKTTNARIGILKTKKGTAETPFFMPVATRGVTKGLTSEELGDMKAQAVISNALILYLRHGSEIIKEFGGIGNFMNHKGLNFTDSGGFQMYSKSIYIKSNNEGVFFRNPINGEKLFITPEKDMEIQSDINSDVAMCLDSMPMYSHSKEQIAEAVEKTSMWAKRCKIHHDKLHKEKEKKQLLFGIIQGGIFPDLREKSAKDLLELNFDGYSIGGFGLGETIDEEFKIVKQIKEMLPENKPVYLMGIGTPVEILKGIALGVDIFDSRMPTQNARHGTLFTSEGNIKITNEKYKLDKSPIDENCNCFVCKNYSKAFIRYQLINDETTGKRLATYHNLYFLTKLIEKAKEKIKEGTLKEFIKEVEEKYK